MAPRRKLLKPDGRSKELIILFCLVLYILEILKFLVCLRKILITYGLCAALINTYMNTQIIIILLHTTTSCRLFGRLTVEMPWNGRWEKSIFCKGPPTLWLRVKDTFRFDKLLGAGEIFIVWTSPLALFISSL